MTKKISKLKLLPLILALTLMASSCLKTGPGQAPNKVFKLGKHMTWVEEVDPSDIFLKKRKLNHPYTMEPEVLEAMLKSFRYKGLALLSKQKNVFTDPPGKKIIALIILALNKARPNEIVKFSYNRKGKKTEGEFFIIGKKAHWRFIKIHNKEFSRNASKNWLDSWKIIIGKGQKYHGVPGLFGGSPVKNWVVTPIQLYKKSTKAKPSEPLTGKGKKALRNEPPGKAKELKKKAAAPEKDLEKDLARLKKLRDRGLITEEEYKTQKAELLKKHF